MRIRSTILGLMGVIAFLAVGMAALRENSESLTCAVFALTFLILCTATLVAIDRRGPWAGFVVFGWAQFWICQPHSAPVVGPTSLPMRIAYQLLASTDASRLVPLAAFRIPGYPAISSDGDGEPMLIIVSGGSARAGGNVPLHRLRAALCLYSIATGFVGAVVGLAFPRRRTGNDPHAD